MGCLNGRALRVSIHTKQSKMDKKMMRMWYVERRQRRAHEKWKESQASKKTKRDKQKRKRIRRFGHSGRAPSKLHAQKGGDGGNAAPKKEENVLEHQEWA